MKTKTKIVWLNKGRANCKGNVRQEVISAGDLIETTCDSCPLRWTMPNETTVKR